jgi:hypothetical protein
MPYSLINVKLITDKYLVKLYEDPNDQLYLVLVQSKDISNLANSQYIIDMIKRIDQTLRDFREYKTSKYNDRLKRILKDKLSIADDHPTIIDLSVFVNCLISKKLRDEIIKTCDSIDEFKNYQISIYDKAQIEEQIKSVLTPRRFVAEGKVKIYSDDGFIQYDNTGLIANISANSLKDLYDRFKDQGLFEQNFRYYIRNKRIDDNINLSLKKKRNIFWFLNNGIIIGCKDFHIDGNIVKIYDFSIINGCQTTTLLGEYKGRNEGEDFSLSCKFVKPEEHSSDEDFFNFISEIAETSNTQKPISDRDLKSNRPEQKELESLLKTGDPKIYIEIKRGKSRVRKNLKDWQHLRNDYLGQLILSFNLQQPGTARSLKYKIFSDYNTYNKIFMGRKDKENMVSLLKLNYYIKDYLDKKDDWVSSSQDSVAINGNLMLLAIIGFMIKIKRSLIDTKKIIMSEEWELEVQKDNIKGNIFSNYSGDDFYDRLNALIFDLICELADFYDKREKEEKTVSNFFKVDFKYYQLILKQIVSRYYNNPRKKNEIEQYMEIFS